MTISGAFRSSSRSFEQTHLGPPLFRKGDPADKLYYLEKGAVRLPEMDRTVGAGEMVGEIGVFSPSKERTASAVRAADSTLLVLDERKALELYYQNPDFGLWLVRAIIRRFLDQQVARAPRPRIGATVVKY